MRELMFQQDEDTLPGVIENTQIQICNRNYDYFELPNVTLNNCEITPTRDIKTLYLNKCVIDTLVINLGKISKISLVDVIADNIILKCNTTYKLSNINIMTSKIGKLHVMLEEPSDSIIGNTFIIELSRHRRSSETATIIKELVVNNSSRRLRTVSLRDTSINYINLERENFILNTIDYAEFKNIRFMPSSTGYTLVNKVALLNGSSFKSYDSGLPDIIVDLSKPDLYSKIAKLKAERELNALERRAPQRLQTVSAPVNTSMNILKTLMSNNSISTFIGLGELFKETIFKHGVIVTPKIAERYYPYIEIKIPEEYSLIYPHKKTYNVDGNPVITEDLSKTVSGLIPRLSNSDALAISKILLDSQVSSGIREGYIRDLFNRGCLLIQDSKYLYFYKR